MRLRVALIIRLDLVNFSFCVMFFASISGVCLQLHVDPLLRDIKGLSGESSQEAYLASWMGHFGTETIHSLFERFSLSNSGSTLNLTNTMLPVDSQFPDMITVWAISELVVPLHRIWLLSAICHSQRVDVNNTNNFVLLYVLLDVGGNTTNASYFQVLHPG